MESIVLMVVKLALVLVPLSLVPLMILMERRGAAFIQDRPGPSRAAIPLPGLRLRAFGMVHNFSDAIKLFFKESFVPPFAYQPLYFLAPAIPVMTAILTPALIPWFAPVTYLISPNHVASTTAAFLDANAGILALFALSSLTVYGVVLGSWASNSKYSLLGGMRASAMMISYEVSMGLSVLGLFLLVGSFSLTRIVEWQAHHVWGVVVQPIGFLLFLTSMFAETNRNPFDVAEGESEIVAGFHTEYSSIKFAMFFMGEYCHIVIASALIATLYFGGYNLPWLGTARIQAHLGSVLGGLLICLSILALIFGHLVQERRARYAKLPASDRAMRLREYSFFMIISVVAAIVLMAGGVASILALNVHPVAIMAGKGIYPFWASLVTAAIQFSIVMVKTLCFCWLFVWVRWTLPRFRYDQIMSLGWKVMLNIALLNLLATAVIAKMVSR